MYIIGKLRNSFEIRKMFYFVPMIGKNRSTCIWLKKKRERERKSRRNIERHPFSEHK